MTAERGLRPRMKVHLDSSRSTEALTIEGSVWEVVFQSYESYWTVATFPDRALAEQLAERGNAILDRNPKGEIGFEVREHKLVTALHRKWSRQDFIDEIDGWDIEDYLLPELDDDLP